MKRNASPPLPAPGHPGLPDSPGGALADLLLRLQHRLVQSALPAPGGGRESIGTLLISLPDSEERRRRLFSRLDRRSWKLAAVEACHPPDRGSLSRGEWRRFHAMADRLRPGQRGCFLSHRRAWLRARESAAALTVVLEDDVVSLHEKMPPLPALPRDLDVLYLHHFAQRIPTPAQALGNLLALPLERFRRPFRVFPIDRVLESHCGRLRLGAMPGSAYAVTPSGADKLLSLFDEVGNYDHWDAIVLRHATSEAVHARMLSEIRSDGIWFYRGQAPERAWSRRACVSINAYAIHPPLFLHDHEAPSVKLAVPVPAASPAGESGKARPRSIAARGDRSAQGGEAAGADGAARTWLLCGIPRSGNGLCCRLVGALPDTVALSQPYHADCAFDGIRVGSLPRAPRDASLRLGEFTRLVRRQILTEGRAPSHQVGGGLYDNIMGSERDADSGLRERRGAWGSVAVTKPLTERFTLFMSQPSVFSALLPALAERFGCLALVRNPLSLLASWQTVNLPFNRGRIAGAEPYDPALRRTLDEEPDRLRRQLFILDWFFARFDAHLERRHVIRYEDLVESGGTLLFRRLGHDRAPPVALESRNDSALYDVAMVETLLDALLAQAGAWTRFYRPADLERVADGIRQGRRSA